MEQPKYISLFQLQAQIKASIGTAFPFPQWVVAEVAEKKVNYSGHCYLELIEKGERSSVPKAKASAVIWKNNYSVLSSYFRSATGNDFAVGMTLLLRVTVSFHELYGMSLQITDIDADYSLGEIAKEREITIAQLKKDGVYDMNHGLPLAELLQKVAVISSKTAAGFQDFAQELSLSPYRVEYTLFDALMQGQGAEQSIIDALDRIIQRDDEFDAVVIIRGGGSQSDLSCFNSYGLCAVVAQFPLPIISGIGHDKDISVVDLVSRLSLKTPTAVAGYLSDNLAEFDAKLVGLYNQLIELANGILTNKKIELDQKVFALTRQSTRLTQRLEIRLQDLKNMLFNSARAVITRQKMRIDKSASSLEGLAPERILSLGFSLVKSEGRTVSDASSLKSGDRVEITMSKGQINAIIE